MDTHDPTLDSPIFAETHEELGRINFVNDLLDTLKTARPPLVCGVEGDWGSGKTSVLHRVFFKLEGWCPMNSRFDAAKLKAKSQAKPTTVAHISTVWFEAWRYQHEAMPIVALLQEMRSQLSTSHKLWAKAKKNAEVTVRGACEIIGDVAKAIMGQSANAPSLIPKGSTIQAIGEDVERRRYDSQLDSTRIRGYLTEAIQQLLPSVPESSTVTPRAVILIDDLDRCEPEAAFRLLEGIKIYLDLPNCIFLLGINRREIEAAIRIALAKKADNREADDLNYRSSEYVEKICTHIRRLPLPDHRIKTDYAKHILETAGTKSSSKPASDPALCLAAIVRQLRAHDCLPANPRKIKTLCNRLLYLIKTLPDPIPSILIGDDADYDRVAGLMLVVTSLYQLHPAIYRVLQSEPQFINELRAQCDNESYKPAARDNTTDNATLHECLRRLNFAQLPAPNIVEVAIPVPSGEIARHFTAPTPGLQWRYSSTFPDPARGDVIRFQSLLGDLPDITVSELQPFLRV